MSGLTDNLVRFGTVFAAKTYKTDGGLRFPAEAYLYVPNPREPSTWRLRVWETPESKETPGQIGRAIAALSPGGFRGNPVEIPDSARAAVKRKLRALWKKVNPDKSDDDMPDTIKMAAFAVDDPDAGVVWHYGKLFEVGDYPDKHFSLTPEEAAEAVAAFSPVDVDIEHVSSQLDSKLGRLESVELTDDGQEIWGMWGIPHWLHRVLGDAERTVSTTWDRATKRIVGLALVRDPRVPDAVLMAHFTAAQEGQTPMDTAAAQAQTALFAAMQKSPEGQRILQVVHDMTAEAGAVHRVRDGKATYHTAPELDALQVLHDTAAEAGATCPMNMADSNAPNLLMPRQAAYSARKDTTVEKGLWDQIKAYFSQAGVQVPDEPPTAGSPAPAAPVAAPVAPADAALLSRNQQLESEVARMRAERIAEKAAEFAAKQIAEGTAFPAERQAIIAQYTQAALDDNHLGVVTFADGSKGSRVDLLAQQFAARPKHALDIERVPANLAALVNLATQPDPKKEGTDTETIQELIALTPAGQAHLSAKNGRSN